MAWSRYWRNNYDGSKTLILVSDSGYEMEKTTIYGNRPKSERWTREWVDRGDGRHVLKVSKGNITRTVAEYWE